MRVSDKVLYNTVINNMQISMEKILKLQENASTGKRINHPSDDPIGSMKVIDYNTAITKAEQYQRNVDNATSFLTMTESAISSTQDVLLRAKELALSALNETNSSADRAIIAEEVAQLYEQTFQTANTKFNGRYIFGGYATSTPPYNGFVIDSSNNAIRFTEGINTYTATLTEGTYNTADALASEVKRALEAANGTNTYTVSYDAASKKFTITNDSANTDSLDILWEDAATTAGDILGFTVTDHPAVTAGNSTTGDNAVGTYAGTASPDGYIEIEVGSGSRVAINMPGYRVFGSPSYGVDLLAALSSLETALNGNDTTGINNAMAVIDSGMNQLNDVMAGIGAKISRLETTGGYLDKLKLDLMTYKSKIEDADITEVITDLAIQQNVLEVSRANLSTILQQTILDFLR